MQVGIKMLVERVNWIDPMHRTAGNWHAKQQLKPSGTYSLGKVEKESENHPKVVRKIQQFKKKIRKLFYPLKMCLRSF